MTIKEHIYTILQQGQGICSGEWIAQTLGVSRVSVWKHIRALRASGLSINSSPKGYSLDPCFDSLHPLGLGCWKDLVYYFQNIPSTMDEAKRLAGQGCPHFTIVVADQQEAGRGRLARVWNSEFGGLYFSVVLRPQISVVEAGLVSLAAAAEMAYVLRTRYRVEAQVKWPNDVLVDGRKLCGIIALMETDDSQVSHVTLGIGLNVNNDAERVIPTAVSLKSLLGFPVQRREIFLLFLERFSDSIATFDRDRVVVEWKENNCTIGRMVKIETLKSRTEGRAVDIDHYGGLVIRSPDGTDEIVNYGDCFITD